MKPSTIPALTTDQMREVDRAMMQDMGITLIQMMENAGRHLAALAREKLGGTVEGKRIVVLVGRGNNGGGGLVAARRLANWGGQVCVVLAAPPDEFRDAPARQLAILEKMHIEIAHSIKGPHTDLILDCLIGYGLRGAPQGVTADLIRQANACDAPVIALDTPSGLDTTTGEILEPCIRADATLTLALVKVGLQMETARSAVGELYVADISVPPQVYAAMGLQVPNLFAKSEIVHINSE